MHGERPDADLLIHPECGCASQCMYAAAQDAALGRDDPRAVHRGHGAARAASPNRDSWSPPRPASSTGCGRRRPDKRFYAMSERAVCRYMKQITLPKVRDSLATCAIR